MGVKMNTLTTPHSVRLAVLCACLTLGSAAAAGPKCTDEPTTKWLTAPQMTQKFKALGFKDDVKKLHISKGQCWEIYGTDKIGQKVEVYFHPITGEIMALNKKG
jgi:hypothetical protein